MQACEQLLDADLKLLVLLRLLVIPVVSDYIHCCTVLKNVFGKRLLLFAYNTPFLTILTITLHTIQYILKN